MALKSAIPTSRRRKSFPGESGGPLAPAESIAAMSSSVRAVSCTESEVPIQKRLFYRKMRTEVPGVEISEQALFFGARAVVCVV
jgi:hypothetical protein